jgi:predicted metal-dependent hydrolase
MAEILVFDNFEVTIVRSVRRKTAAIKVDLSGVSVRVPQSLAQERIRELVAEKSDWVERKLEISEQKRRAIAAQEARSEHLDTGSLILIQGRQVPLDLREDRQMSVAEESGQLIVRGPDAMSGEPEQRRALVEQWLYAARWRAALFASTSISKRWGPARAPFRSKITERDGVAVSPMAVFS